MNVSHLTATEVAQIVRLRQQKLPVQVIASRCGRTVPVVQKVLELQLGERPHKGRK